MNVRPFNLGLRVNGEATHWPSGRLKRDVRLNKFARRILRGRAFRGDSSIERAIANARAHMHEAQSLATNSHEAKRYIKALRREERQP